MLYAGEAFEVAAPTSDPTVLESEIAVLGPGVMPGGGSRPAAALALARDMLKDGEAPDVVLVSDGGGIDDAARAEAERLRSAGIRISALVLSASAGGSARPEALTALADAAASASAPDPVLSRLGGRAVVARDDALTALRFRDLGPLVAALALVPLLALFRRSA